MAKGRYLLDGEQIVERRRKRGWSQEELAEHTGLAPRTIQHVEANEGAFQRETVERLAEALDVDPEQFIWCELVSWQQIPQMRDSLNETKLSRAIRNDMEGRHATAAGACQEILDGISLENEPEEYAAVLIKLVTFLDHDGQHATALEAVKHFLQQGQHNDFVRRQVAWARYHQAICLRRMGNFQEARQILKQLRQDEGHRYVTSSLHQLATVELEEAKQLRHAFSAFPFAVEEKLEQARRLFEECLTEWEKLEQRLRTPEASPDQALISSTHRIGFTLRRLGETLALLGLTKDALYVYHRALATFAWHRCRRYVTETYQEMAQLMNEWSMG